MLETEIASVELSCWGAAVSLGWLVLHRMWDALAGRRLLQSERPAKAMESPLVAFAAGILSAGILLDFTGPVFSGWATWLERTDGMVLPAMLTTLIVLAIFIERLAYNIRLKFWSVGFWITLAHVAKWGMLWLR